MKSSANITYLYIITANNINNIIYILNINYIKKEHKRFLINNN